MKYYITKLMKIKILTNQSHLACLTHLAPSTNFPLGSMRRNSVPAPSLPGMRHSKGHTTTRFRTSTCEMQSMM